MSQRGVSSVTPRQREPSNWVPADASIPNAGMGPCCYNGDWGGHMKISTVREFRDNATGLMRSKDPILVTRRGRLAGIFFPRPEATLPLELKRELFALLSSEIARQIKKRGISEKEIAADFHRWRKNKREAGR